MVICSECGKRWTQFYPVKYNVTIAGAQVVEKLSYKKMMEVYWSDRKAMCMECLDSLQTNKKRR